MSHDTPTPQPGPTMRDAERMSDDQMRQGETGTGLRYVLAIRTIAALVALGVVFWTMA